VGRLVEQLTDPRSAVPAAARAVLTIMVDTLRLLEERIALFDKEIIRRAREDQEARRLMTIPGVGPITATALIALAPAASQFRRARDFAAWLGLTPKEHSSGGKQRFGVTSKMGERTLRRLLIMGASAVVQHFGRRKPSKESWLAQMLSRKPRMLVIVALANKMARIVWAMMTTSSYYRASVGAA
jgi:transposase